MQIGLGLSITAQLRFGSSLSSYAVNDFDPSLVFDFEQNYYRTGGTDSTLSSSVTHAATSNATMTDSDGNIKWRPHNLLSSSDAFGDTSVTLWDNFGAAAGPHEEVVMSNGATGYRFNVTNDRDFMNKTYDVVAGAEYTFKLWIESVVYISGSQNLVSLFGTSTQILEQEFTSAGYYSFTYTSSTTGTNTIRVGAGNSANTTLNFVCGQPHIYRSDLGGMVDNPATGDSYVPTTSSPVYLPRVGHHIYNGSAWVNEGVLHESEARTNIVNYSSDFSSYTKLLVNTSVPTGITSPDGTENSTQIVTTSGSGVRRIYDITPNGDSSLSWCLSLFVKHKDDINIKLWLNGATQPNSEVIAYFAISASGVSLTSTETGSTSSTAEAGVENVGNGWYRVYVKTAQLHTNSSAKPTLFMNLETSISGAGLYMYGLQIEQGSTPSSYIPTSGSTVTRAAETLTVPAANMPYSSTNMSIQIDGKITYADTSNTFERMWWEWKLSSSDNMKIHLSTSGASTGLPTFTQKRNATDSPSGVPNNVYSPGIDVPFNLASRHGSTFINGASEGTSYTVNTTPTSLPNLSATDLTLGTIFMGTIGKFRMWSEDLTDTGIEEAST